MGSPAVVDLDTLMERVRRVAAPPKEDEPAGNGAGGPAAWVSDAARAQAEFNRGVVESLGSTARLLGRLREETAAAEKRALADAREQAVTVAALSETLARLDAGVGEFRAAAADTLAGLEARMCDGAARQVDFARHVQALARRVDDLTERLDALTAGATEPESRAAAWWSRVRALMFRA